MTLLENRKKSSVSYVVNVLDILRSFTIDEPEKGVLEVSNSLGMPKSVVQRIMATLASEGFLEQNPSTRKYRLGFPFLSLSSIVMSNSEAHKEAFPLYKELADKLNETVRVCTLEGSRVTNVHFFECKFPHKAYTHIGKDTPIHCTSAGRVLLAFHQDEELIERVIDNGLKRYTSYTITDPDLFRAEISKVRSQGYSICEEEFGLGGISFAVPLKDSSRSVNFAIQVICSSKNFDRSKISYYIKEMQKTASNISTILEQWDFKRYW
ncbi:IclR family transcriptional regulator [Niallia oryzisoli]|uniref:IclR family transcriptional regulator n=1 Tax=Niallia oryzisoli TaxID=1737571 RepID=A0ABZ2CA15_9BACI